MDRKNTFVFATKEKPTRKKICWKESKYSNEKYRKVRQDTQDRTSRTEPLAKAIRTSAHNSNGTVVFYSPNIHSVRNS
jgi:hypothetical protein